MAPVTRRTLGALAVGLMPVAVMLVAAPAFPQALASPSKIARWQPFIAEASRRFGIPDAWIGAVMRAETGGQVTVDERPITSRAGAMGVMQLMPETWAELRDRYALGSNPYDPRDNILAGAAYLRELYARYGYPNLFAAYNAGPARLDDYLFNGRPLPHETLSYLATLGQTGFVLPRTSIIPCGTSLFFALHGTVGGLSVPMAAPSSDGLFLPSSRAPERKP